MRENQLLIDAHAHLDQYGEGLESALKEINQNRIFTISTSIDLPSYRQNVKISRASSLVVPTFGIHPWKAPEYENKLNQLQSAIEESPMLGEIGLDFHWVNDVSQYASQLNVFEFFLSAAKQQKKIVNLHTKGAEQEILDLLRRYAIEASIIHWYSGPANLLTQFIDLGAYFTIGIEVLHSEHIQKIARALPTDHLLTETDSPGASNRLTGFPGEPQQILDVIEALADLRKITTTAVIETVQTNFKRLIQEHPRVSDIYSKVL